MSITENTLSEEIWKDVPGYEGYYQISSLGRVKVVPKVVKSRNRASGVNTRTISESIKVNEIAYNGYARITLSKLAKSKRYSVHRLVAIAFIPNPENKPAVNHINGIKTDNRIENLGWVTNSENEMHSFRVLGKKIIHSEEARKKMSIAQIGRKFSDEAKKKMSLAKIGKRMSDETKKKISDYQKKHPVNYWLGKKMSEETKLKMSLSHKK